MSGEEKFTRKLSFRNLTRRLSFRRKNNKKKNNKKDRKTEGGSDGVQVEWNPPLVPTENVRLTSDKRTLSVDLESEQTHNKRNSFVEQQTDLSGDVVSVHDKRTLEEEIRHLKTQIHYFKQLNCKHGRENIDLKNKVQCLEDKITILLTDKSNLREELESINRNVKDIQTELERQKPTNSTTLFSDTAMKEFEQLKNVMSTCSETTNHTKGMMEDMLAREMEANTSKQERVPDIPSNMYMSSDIKTFAWKLQTKMVTMDKVGHLGRALGVEPDTMDRLLNRTQTPRDAFWETICLWCKQYPDKATKQNPDKATVACLWKACHKAGIDINEPMPEYDRQVFEFCYSYLEDNLMPILTLPYLRDEGVFDNSDIYYVTSQPMRRERCCAILTLLPLLGVRAFDVFCSALRQSGQEHLAKTLEEGRKSFPKEQDKQRVPSEFGETEWTFGGNTLVKHRFPDSDFQCLILGMMSTMMGKLNFLEANVNV